MRGSFKLSELNNQFPALHGLRVLAIFSVVAHHVTFAIWRDFKNDPNNLTLLERFVANQWFAMDLFFVLSGFLIGGILFFQMGRGSNKILRFYWRRAFRTFPLYYAVLFIYAALVFYWPQLKSSGGADHIDFFHELFYLTNYPFRPAKYLMFWSWSLSAEEQFYLLCPWLVLLIFMLKRNSLRLFLLVSCFLSAFLLRMWTFLNLMNGNKISIMRFLFTPIHNRYDTFVGGLILAFLYHNYRDQIAQILKNKYVDALSLYLPIGVFLYFLDPWGHSKNLYLSTYYDYATAHSVALYCVFACGLISSLAFIPFIFHLIFSQSFLTKFLGNRIFLKIATLSYAVFLIHLPIVDILCRNLLRIFPIFTLHPDIFWFLLMGTSSAISLGLAYILHLVIEKPFLQIRDRLDFFN